MYGLRPVAEYIQHTIDKDMRAFFEDKVQPNILRTRKVGLGRKNKDECHPQENRKVKIKELFHARALYHADFTTAEKKEQVLPKK